MNRDLERTPSRPERRLRSGLVAWARRSWSRRYVRLGALPLAALACCLGLWSANVPQRLLAELDADPGRLLPSARDWCDGEGQPLSLRVVSANIECCYCGSDGDPAWESRSERTAAFLAASDADLIGLQEVISEADLAELLPEDSPWEALAPSALGFTYADAVLLYRRERFEPLESGAVWLGPEPEVPFGAGWALGWPRYINWVLLRERETDQRFLFANTHFDPRLENKDRSAVLFRETLAELARRGPVVVTGDFNTCSCAQRFEVIAADPMLDTLALASAEDVELAAAWPPERVELKLRDHVLVAARQVAVRRWALDEEGVARSDHPYLTVDLDLCTRAPAAARLGEELADAGRAATSAEAAWARGPVEASREP